MNGSASQRKCWCQRGVLDWLALRVVDGIEPDADIMVDKH